MNGVEYSYVPKSKVKILAREAEAIIADAREILWEKDITFDPILVGSGDRNMVTCIKDTDVGYDLDYNLILKKFPRELEPYQIKALFQNAFNVAVRNTGYSYPQDSTSVLTIKKLGMYGQVLRSIDFAILSEFSDSKGPYLKYIRNEKRPFGPYVWAVRGRGGNHFDDKREELKQNPRLWNMVRDEYLKLKNANEDEDKRSFDLYAEAVSNIYEQQIRHHKDIRNKEVKKNVRTVSRQRAQQS